MTGPAALRAGVGSGAVAGVAGGLVFGAAMAQLGALPTVASIVRSDSVLVGLVVHLTIAALIGAGFGLVVLRQRIAAGETLFWGLAYGAFWWLLGPLTLLPLLVGRRITWDLPSAQAQVPSLLGHLAYGATTALALVILRRRSPLAAKSSFTAATALRGVLAAIAVSGVLSLLLGPGNDPAAAWGGLVGSPLLGVVVLGGLSGLGYAGLAPHSPEGGGPALIRGVAYGFVLWAAGALTAVPLLAGRSLDWSLPAARAGVATLPGYLLLGGATALVLSWLAGLMRALFTDDVRRLHEEGAGTRGLRAARGGALGGLVGGLLFTIVMVQIGFLSDVARLVGAGSASAGLLVHLTISLTIGVSYGLLFRRRSHDVASALGWGLAYGFFWWVLGALTLYPVLIGGSPLWSAPAMASAFASLVGHLAYGAGLGLAYHRVESRTHPWWVGEAEAQAARMARRREQLLGSAPALWAFTSVIVLTVPLLVGG